MNILGWRIRRPVVIATAVAVLLAAVCGGVFVSGWRPWASASVLAGTPVSGADVRVLLPADADHGKFHFWATEPSDAAMKSLTGKKSVLVPLAPLHNFHSSPVAPKGTQLRFVVRKGLKPEMVFEAYYDAGTGQWRHEPTTYNPATGVATATVAHFSVHSIFTWGADRVKALLEGALKNMFGALAVGQPPTCRSANGVVMYDSNRSDSVLSCREATIVEQPRPPGNPGAADIVAKLVNNRHYPMDVEYPAGASATTDDPGSVAQQIGAAITKFVTSRPGQSQLLLTSAAKAKVTVPRSSPQFAHVKVTTTLDGEAYLVGLLQTGVDELSQMTGVKLSTLTKNLIDGLGGEEVLYRISTELTSSDLSLNTLKTLGDVGLDALKVALDNSGTWLAGLASVIVSLGDDLWQSVSGFIDTISGQTFHEYTFRAYGPLWNQITDIHQTDWGSVSIPGDWFGGPSQVRLSNGMAHVSTSHGPVTVSALTGAGQVQYGDLFGNGQDEAALEVWVENDPGGTAASQVAQGWMVFQSTPSGLKLIGEILPRVPPTNAWAPNPVDRPHVSFIASVVIVPGGVKCLEFYYHHDDFDAHPTGRGRYEYALVNGKFMTPPDVLPFPTP